MNKLFLASRSNLESLVAFGAFAGTHALAKNAEAKEEPPFETAVKQFYHFSIN
jgi:uncharacterized membrane protein YgdD (TMEM256/DUF423 family)